MTVFIDDIAISKDDRVWYHLMSDTDGDEIHNFANRLGLKRSWFHVDHYDLTEGKRQQAIRMGAKPAKAIDLVAIRKARRKL